MSRARIANQPALVLHLRAYRETSLLVDVLSRDHGRVAGVLKGRRKAGRGAGVQPFWLLDCSWSGGGGLVTFTTMEPQNTVWLKGNSLASAYYAVELIMRLTREREPHPGLFTTLQWLIGFLAEGHEIGVGLRQFERVLLEELGYGVEFDRQAQSGEAIDPAGQYRFEAGLGFVAAASGRYEGAVLLAIANGEWRTPGVRAAARDVFRAAIAPLLGDRPLQSRRLLNRGA